MKASGREPAHRKGPCVQADINQEADQFEEVLRRNRARMEAASRELADWELQTARARNEGTFFKGLFKADILQPPSDESGASPEPEPSAEVHPAHLHRHTCTAKHAVGRECRMFAV